MLTAQFGRIGCGSLRAISSVHLFLILDSLLLSVSEIVFPFAGLHFRLHPLSEIHFSLRNSFSSAPSTPQTFRTALLSTNLSFSVSSPKYIFVCAPHIPSISFGPATSNSFFSLSSPEFNLVCALCASNHRSALSAAILPFFPSLLRINC